MRDGHPAAHVRPAESSRGYDAPPPGFTSGGRSFAEPMKWRKVFRRASEHWRSLFCSHWLGWPDEWARGLIHPGDLAVLFRLDDEGACAGRRYRRWSDAAVDDKLGERR